MPIWNLHEYVSFKEIQIKACWVLSGKKKNTGYLPGYPSHSRQRFFSCLFTVWISHQMEISASCQLHLDYLCSMDVLMQLPAISPARDENRHPEIIQHQPFPNSEPNVWRRIFASLSFPYYIPVARLSLPNWLVFFFLNWFWPFFKLSRWALKHAIRQPKKYSMMCLSSNSLLWVKEKTAKISR